MADAKPKGIPMRARLKAQDEIMSILAAEANQLRQEPQAQAFDQQVARIKKLFQIEE